ncbi:Mediator of RNA polymerase II transcription subunit 7 [Cladophialophora chaetospira]|uniref:Mediator of RNA polymerase II transcription subunit 7 n=1 Tax=Cladophialophora chaetospira TaxID=386627 RepID=A0AA38X5E6_9EURO|nr:Mediator of RNA polymerase II transcription subunit 7 [Cladophialophora chaetospira]
MAEAEQPQQIPEAAYPAPPPFWRHFTLANEEELKQIEASSNDEQPTRKLPLHLAYLRPPPPPSEATEFYTTFGQKQIIDPTKPSSLPTDQLLFSPDEPSLNHAVLLSKLTKSLLLNFLELTSVLSLDPAEHEEKMADIRQLLINIHVVINLYRPHQARESVKEMLEGILEDGQREIDECNRLKERVEEFLVGVGKAEGSNVQDSAQASAGAQVQEDSHNELMDKQRELWKMIHEMT